jgi:hypothetical protein
MAEESLWDALVSGLSSTDSGGEGSATSYPVSSGGDAYGVDLSTLSDLFGSSASGAPTEAAPASSSMAEQIAQAYRDSSRSNDVLPSSMAQEPSFADQAKGWLNRLGAGDRKAEGQAKLGIGALGLLDAFLRNRRVGRGQKSPAELRAMTAGRFNNWTPQQQVSADRYFGGNRQFTYQKPPGMADGGPVRYEPKVGTMGPRRRGETGEYDREAVMRAIAAANAASAPVPNTGDKFARWRDFKPRPEVRNYAEGGDIDMSMLVQGDGGGQDDTVPINASNGEYVIDADAVSALGDGSNEEGARRLDEMVQMLRQHKRSAPPSEIPPQASPPLSYIGRE